MNLETGLWLPSTFFALNYTFGGGIPFGKILEVAGEEAPEHKFGIADGGKEAEKCAVRNILTGSFTVTSPSADNHGPVRVAGTYYLAYEDGTPYHCIGTTCYVWNLQNEELQKQTLKTLEENAFNKIRFCIFPKHYDYNLHEPITYPYEGTPCDSSVLNENNFAALSL